VNAHRRLGRSAIALSLAMLLSACSQSMDIQLLLQTDKICQDFKVIRPTKADKISAETAKTILGNNEARVVYGCKKLENEAVTT
jgi:hypothetical protein